MYFSGSPAFAAPSIIGSTRAGAPPCSGPESVPTADDIAAAQSAPVEAAMRAVNVEAFRPCSAAEIQYVSSAFTARGSASPRQRIRNCAAAFSPFSISDSGTAGCLPRAAWATIVSVADEPCEVVARLLVVDVDELLQAPLRPERRERSLQVGGNRAARILEVDRLGGRQRRVDVLVDEQAPHVLERVACPTSSSMSTPR